MTRARKEPAWREVAGLAFVIALPLASALAETRILVFSKTAGFRHDSIAAGQLALVELGAQYGFGVEATEDAAAFSAANLERFAAVVFLSTTGDVLDAGQQAAFEAYIAAGGGWVGIHAASDTEYDWPWYGGLVGAYFARHPEIQQGEVHVEVSDHPATIGVPNPWRRTDEWYDFRDNPRDRGVTVLLTLDETSYNGGMMGGDHPIAWYHAYEGGRAFYTAGGHTAESFAEPAFRAHLAGAIRYATGELPPSSAVNIVVGGRYRLNASWRAGDDSRGQARFTRVTPDTATMWFFSASNVEVVVKVLDGCGVNGHRWVFAAGLTDLRVDLRVVDLETGIERGYTSPLGVAYPPLQDTAAFSCN